jgi:hypothetical protein
MRPARVKAAMNLDRMVLPGGRAFARRHRSSHATSRSEGPKTAARAIHLRQNRRPALAPVPATLRTRASAPTAAGQQSP